MPIITIDTALAIVNEAVANILPSQTTTETHASISCETGTPPDQVTVIHQLFLLTKKIDASLEALTQNELSAPFKPRECVTPASIDAMRTTLNTLLDKLLELENNGDAKAKTLANALHTLLLSLAAKYTKTDAEYGNDDNEPICAITLKPVTVYDGTKQSSNDGLYDSQGYLFSVEYLERAFSLKKYNHPFFSDRPFSPKDLKHFAKHPNLSRFSEDKNWPLAAKEAESHTRKPYHALNPNARLDSLNDVQLTLLLTSLSNNLCTAELVEALINLGKNHQVTVKILQEKFIDGLAWTGMPLEKRLNLTYHQMTYFDTFENDLRQLTDQYSVDLATLMTLSTEYIDTIRQHPSHIQRLQTLPGFSFDIIKKMLPGVFSTLYSNIQAFTDDKLNDLVQAITFANGVDNSGKLITSAITHAVKLPEPYRSIITDELVNILEKRTTYYFSNDLVVFCGKRWEHMTTHPMVPWRQLGAQEMKNYAAIALSLVKKVSAQYNEELSSGIPWYGDRSQHSKAILNYCLGLFNAIYNLDTIIMDTHPDATLALTPQNPCCPSLFKNNTTPMAKLDVEVRVALKDVTPRLAVDVNHSAAVY